MRRDVLELREFYDGPLGRAAQAMVSRKIAEAWGDLEGLDVLGLGYATPFLTDRLSPRRVVAAMPASQGVEVWPPNARNLACLVDEKALPFMGALFDRVLVAHGLEEADDPVGFLEQVWRAMSPSGQLILVVAARDGLWANADHTPFGHGRPYSRRQLEQLLQQAELQPTGWTRALYAPPVRWAARWVEGFEQAGAWLWPRFSGLILMQAVKQTFAPTPKPVRERVRVLIPGALQPSPAAGRAASRLDPLRFSLNVPATPYAPRAEGEGPES